ncbi:hypothetical protein B0T20DRAFT_496757 [Sordaria brevicollis]|uniref:BHLH domain-containing protein n=1 Tax=Sordaria brevicollis TaxID=83679 RepID=A0AAE0PI43_SORBR|nr:hypothetical protein B0T20DRAFT_496757 [Sordaria brevicollis]
MSCLDNNRQQSYDDIPPSTHPSIPYNHFPDAYNSSYASSDHHNFAHSDLSTPTVPPQSQSENYTVSSTISAPVQTVPFGSHGLYTDHYIPYPLRTNSLSNGTNSIGLAVSTSALAVSDPIGLQSPPTFVLSSPASPLTAYSTGVHPLNSFPSEAWPTHDQAHEVWSPHLAGEGPTNTTSSLQQIPHILKPVLAKDYHEDDRYVDHEITATYASTYQRSQVASPAIAGATKKKEKLRKRRHRLAQADDGQAVDAKFEDMDSTQSPLSTVMDFPTAASPGLTTSRRSSLLWVQEDVAGSLMNPKGKDKGRKEESRSHKKRKQHENKRATSERGPSRRDFYAEQARDANAYEGDEDLAMDYTPTLDNNTRTSLPTGAYDLDCDAKATQHKASPRQEIARVKHNKVEQKYRNRLNAHFEALLDVLPPSAALSTSEQDMQDQAHPLIGSNTAEMIDLGIAEKERRVSKSEVLDRARLYIQTLESEHKRLAAERKQLRKMWDEYGNASRKG